MKKLLLIFVLIVPLFAKPLNVLYIWHTTKEQPFTQLVDSFAHAVAKDLKINLITVFPDGNKTSDYGNTNRYSYESFAKPYFFSKHKPDVVISVLFRKTGKRILDFSHSNRLPLFIVNTNIAEEDRVMIKSPREIYPHFLGLLASNEKQAGQLLLDSLVKQAKEHKKDEIIEIIGISGPREATEAIERNRGLVEGLPNYNNVLLHQIVYANWDEKIAYEKSLKLLNRYPSLDIIWTASDSMALGAKKAIKKLGKDVLVGGIDWSKKGIKGIRNQELSASVGGHFMNGGIALILLYDHFNGKDFKEELGTEINLNMFALTSKNVKSYSQGFSTQNWDKIDFSQYSKVLNPSLEKYDFSFEKLMHLSKDK